MSEILRRVLPYLLLLIEVVVFHRSVLIQRDHVMPWDIRGFHLPHAHLYTDAIQAGELPLWDPYTYCGRPFQANIQTQVLYPGMATAALLGSIFGHEHLLYFLEWNVAAHTFLAGCFAFLLGLAIGLDRPSALLAATAYQLGGFFAAHVEHMGAICTAAWLPLAWYAVISMRAGATWRPGLLLAASLALSVFAGHTPVTAVVFSSSLALAALLVALGGASWRVLATTAVACLVSLALAAVQLGPSVELTWNTIGQYRTDWLGSGGGVPLTALVSLVSPNHSGVFDLSRYHEPYDVTFMYLYSSWAAAALTAATLIRPRTRTRLVFAAILMLTGFAMLGDSTWLWRVFYRQLPVSVKIGLHPEFTSPAFLLSLAILAGIGLAAFVPAGRLRWMVVVVAAVDLIAVSSGRPMNAQPLASAPGVTRTQFDGSPAALDRIRQLTGDTTPPSRIDTVSHSMSWAMAAPTTRVPTANGNDPLALARVIQVRLAFVKGERWGSYYEVEDLRSPVLGMLNIKYLLSRQPIPSERLDGSTFAPAGQLPDGFLYENRAVLPRFWLVSRVRSASSVDQAARLLRDPGFDPSREAIVEGASGFERSTTEPTGTVRVISYGTRALELEVAAASDAYLVSSEAHYPGWRAWVDGIQTSIRYTNVAFRGLPVPRGRHTIRMKFSPGLLWWSMALSAAAWIAWGALWWKLARPPAAGAAQ